MSDDDINDVTLLKRRLLAVLLEQLQGRSEVDPETGETIVIPVDAKVMTVALGTLKAFMSEIKESVTLAQATEISERLKKFAERRGAH